MKLRMLPTARGKKISTSEAPELRRDPDTAQASWLRTRGVSSLWRGWAHHHRRCVILRQQERPEGAGGNVEWSGLPERIRPPRCLSRHVGLGS